MASDLESQLVKEMEATMASGHNDDDGFILTIADQVVEESESSGKPLVFPNSKPAEDREAESDYPAPVIKDAKARWNAMSADEKETFKTSVEDRARAAIAEEMHVTGSAVRSRGFTASWGVLDILFVVLAIASAFRIGSTSGGE